MPTMAIPSELIPNFVLSIATHCSTTHLIDREQYSAIIMTVSNQTLRVLFHFVLMALLAGIVVQGQNATNDDLIDCPLCSDPTYTPQDPLSRFVTGAQTLTCQSAFELGPLQLPAENCTFWQSRGDLICQCALEPPETNECTLCESGVLPEPLKEGLPGKVCSAVQVDAKRGSEDLCVVYQQTIGIYCGCDNPEATSVEQDVCRLCGGDRKLPVPMEPITMVDQDGEDIETSCVELEFLANIPGADCQEFQDLYGQTNCCPTASPTLAPTDGGPTRTCTVVLGISIVGALGFLAELP
jgi:hypothetical protein